MTLLQVPFSLLSPAGSHARLSIFIFHRVLPTADPIFPGEPDAKAFDEIALWISSWFKVLPLDVAVDLLKRQQLPARAAAITFDDGYADNHDVALPILQRHGLSATFFIASGFLNGGRMWNDTVIESIRRTTLPVLDLERLQLGCHPLATTVERRHAIENIISKIKYLTPSERAETTLAISEISCTTPPTDLMLSSAQVCTMRQAGMVIGAHTRTHPILARTSIDEARREISEGREELQALLGEPIDLFAYPNGKPGTDYLPEHCLLVEQLGFSAAVSTTWGAACSSSSSFQLPRFTPWNRTKLKFGLRLISNMIKSHRTHRPTGLP